MIKPNIDVQQGQSKQPGARGCRLMLEGRESQAKGNSTLAAGQPERQPKDMASNTDRLLNIFSTAVEGAAIIS